MTEPQSTRNKTIFLAAGGTGGHMFPAIALAEDLLSRGYAVRIITDTRGKKYCQTDTLSTKIREGEGDLSFNVIASSSLSGNPVKKLLGVAKLALGFVQSILLILTKKADLVVGFGGYPSLPAVFAAQFIGVDTILHEQNAIIGRANHFLSSRAERIALSLPKTKGLTETDSMRAVLTGNPVRSSISKLYVEPYPNIGKDSQIRLFVMGGSLGAHVFSDILPKALVKLPEDLLARLYVVQQCLAQDIEDVREFYKTHNIEATLAEFFPNVADELAKSHLVISRSGAGAVAEITTAGRPAIFVPYPHHKDRQQSINANVVADKGGAWVFEESDLDETVLSEKLEKLFSKPQALFDAAEASRGCARPDATRKLGNLVTALASGWDHD